MKRVIIISGHYGSGKTNIAVSLALDIKKENESVTLLDIDIVNPYFRSKDSQDILEQNGVRLICSKYANSNVDIPALPAEIYSVTSDLSGRYILDVGGDERGALALGRLSPKILEENNYDMFLVVNKYRPLTKDVTSTIEVMLEIENACGLKFTGVINNSNLGEETTKEDVINSISYAKEVAKTANIKYLFTTVSEKVYNSLENKEGFYPIILQHKITNN